MLPAAKSHRFSLADVLPNCLDALAGRTGRLGLPPVTHAIVLLADGLGRSALDAHRGHARTLASRLDVDPAISAGFPTTTASALATLTTGRRARPARHGRLPRARPRARRGGQPAHRARRARPGGLAAQPDAVRDRGRGRGSARSRSGRRVIALSGFTAAVLRGAEYHGAVTVAERFAARPPRCSPRPGRCWSTSTSPNSTSRRTPTGSTSARWIAALEELDAAVGALVAALGPRQGLLVTADHGMVDVPESAQVLIPAGAAGRRAPRRGGAAAACSCISSRGSIRMPWPASGGSARARAPGSRPARRRSTPAGSERSTRSSGRASATCWSRRASVSRSTPTPTTPARRMIGQHGSLTRDETAIPLLRFGAFAG